MVPFAVYTTIGTPNAFHWAGQVGTTPKIYPFLWGTYPVSRPHLIHGFLDLRESALQTASRSDQPFFSWLTNVTNRQIHRPRYSIRSNGPRLAIAAMRPNNRWLYRCERAARC